MCSPWDNLWEKWAEPDPLNRANEVRKNLRGRRRWRVCVSRLWGIQLETGWHKTSVSLLIYPTACPPGYLVLLRGLAVLVTRVIWVTWPPPLQGGAVTWGLAAHKNIFGYLKMFIPLYLYLGWIWWKFDFYKIHFWSSFSLDWHLLWSNIS